ncbi:MAG: MFS transporter, partial [Anaerolineales bacterium]|nr:MFS transporter [Anaerolineales bacterium]
MINEPNQSELDKSDNTDVNVDTPGARSWKNTFTSLKNRGYFFLWLGMIAMMASVQMQMVARGYLVYDLTSSASLLGIVTAGSALPILALALFGGAIADRINKKWVVQTSQGLMCLLSVVVGILIFTESVTWVHLLISSTLQGAVWAFLMPARQALIPELVGKQELSNAIALNAAGMSAMTLIAPTIAGVIYAIWGVGIVYIIIASLAGMGLILTSMVHVTSIVRRVEHKDMGSDIMHGLKYVMKSPLIRLLILVGLVSALLIMPIRFLLPVLVVEIYHLRVDALGVLLSAMGVGALVGSLFIAWVGRWKRGGMLIAGTFGSGVAMLLLAILPFYIAGILLMLILGLGDAARRGLNQALVMDQVSEAYRGRVMSLYMMNFGLMPLGVLPLGIIADLWGPQIAVAILGIILTVVGVGLFSTQVKLR